MVPKAASYSPSAMPMPVMAQARYQPTTPGVIAKPPNPSAVTRGAAINTSRPPRVSIQRPTRGEAAPQTSNPAENPPTSIARDTPRSTEAGPDIVAGM